MTPQPSLAVQGRLLHWLAAPVLVCLTTLLGGCALGKWAGIVPLNPLKTLEVVAQVGANQDTATAIDIVWVFDSTALAALPKTGPLWFANKAALQANLATSLAVVSLEVAPASALQSVPLPAKHGKAIAVLAFANTLAVAGQAVGTLTPFKCALITLAPASVAYAACPA